MSLRKLGLALLCLCLVTVAVSGCGQQAAPKEEKKATPTPAPAPKPAAKPGWPTKMSIGAGSAGGGMFMAASAIAAALQKALPELGTTVEITGAAVENSQLLQAKQVEMGLITSEVAWEAFTGKYTFEGKPCTSLRTIFPGYKSVNVFVVLSNSGINKLTDLNGKIVSPGTKNSANEVFATRVIEVAGIKPKGMQAMRTPDATAALQAKQIDCYQVGIPNSTTSELDFSVSGGVKLLFLEGDIAKKFAEKYPQYIQMTLEKGALKNVTQDVKHFGSYVSFFVNESSSEDLVYAIVKACYEKREEIIKNSNVELYKGMDLANIGMTTVPYHKGAIKYFQEKGIKVPDNLIPK